MLSGVWREEQERGSELQVDYAEAMVQRSIDDQRTTREPDRVVLQKSIGNAVSAVRRPPRALAVVVSSADTVFSSRARRDLFSGNGTAERSIRLPDGRPARLLVVGVATTRGPRTAFWVVGVLGILLLGVGVARERHQSLQVAARSSDVERLSIEALRANAMKSEFLANVSHELRTPLTAIVGFVEMLRDGVYGELAPRQIGPVDRIAASATHLRHLVDQILDIARIAVSRRTPWS